MEKAVTIYDVAKAAGVAPSTVSRAFSRPGRLNAATAERILRVGAALGYQRGGAVAAAPAALRALRTWRALRAVVRPTGPRT